MNVHTVPAFGAKHTIQVPNAQHKTVKKHLKGAITAGRQIVENLVEQDRDDLPPDLKNDPKGKTLFWYDSRKRREQGEKQAGKVYIQKTQRKGITTFVINTNVIQNEEYRGGMDLPIEHWLNKLKSSVSQFRYTQEG